MLAATANLPRAETFRAWLSAGSDSPAGWVGELDPNKGYRLPSGTKVADDWVQLTSGTLKVQIDQKEDKTHLTGQETTVVWTGTTADGEASASTCDGWTSPDSQTGGLVGSTSKLDVKWSAAATIACKNEGRIYCVEIWKAK